MIQVFEGVNRLFILSFENNLHQRKYERYFLPTVKIKDYNVMIDGENVLDQPIKNDQRTYDNVRKIVTGQGYDYTTVGLLHHVYFINYYNMIAVD